MTKTKIKIIIASLALIAFSGYAAAQSGFWSNWPIVNGAAYSCGTVNAVSTCTVPAGPTALTGNENIPANTNLSGGQSPQNVLITPATLNALPITIQAAVVSSLNAISAATMSGGYVFTAASTISTVNLTLPLSPANKQQFVISANRTITTLNVSAAAGASIAGNSGPTGLTASTTAPQGYKLIYNSADTSWYRLQ